MFTPTSVLARDKKWHQAVTMATGVAFTVFDLEATIGAALSAELEGVLRNDRGGARP